MHIGRRHDQSCSLTHLPVEKTNGILFIVIRAERIGADQFGKAIGVMGGQQIASVGKIINVEMQYLQFPAAAANAVILIITTLMIIYGMTRIVDVRKEL